MDGAIGELSQFHETYQYYAQGVSTSTAVLGPGWEDRLVVFENASTRPGRGLCLDPHDCVAAKLVAGRDKDFEFAAALLREELVDAGNNHRKDRGPPGPVQPEAAPLQLGEGESGKGTGHLAFSAASSTRLGAESWVTSIVGLLVAKVGALVGGDKPKDAQDIVWLLEAWPPEVRKSSRRRPREHRLRARRRRSHARQTGSRVWRRRTGRPARPSLASPRHRTFAERRQKKAGTPLSSGIWPSNFGFLLI